MTAVAAYPSGDSLSDLLNRLARHPEAIVERRAAPRAAARDGKGVDVGELERFMALDPLTVTLYKRYVDARAHYLSVLGMPEGAAMADVAADLAQSAWSALETRLHELRGDARLSGRSANLALLETQDRARRREIAESQESRLLRDALTNRQAERSNRFFWMWFLSVWFGRQTPWDPAMPGTPRMSGRAEG